MSAIITNFQLVNKLKPSKRKEKYLNHSRGMASVKLHFRDLLVFPSFILLLLSSYTIFFFFACLFVSLGVCALSLPYFFYSYAIPNFPFTSFFAFSFSPSK